MSQSLVSVWWAMRKSKRRGRDGYGATTVIVSDTAPADAGVGDVDGLGEHAAGPVVAHWGSALGAPWTA